MRCGKIQEYILTYFLFSFTKGVCYVEQRERKTVSTQYGLTDLDLSKAFEFVPQPPLCHSFQCYALPHEPVISTAVHLPGAGSFVNGSILGAQYFKDGAFAIFESVRKGQLQTIPLEDLHPRIEKAEPFIGTRTYPDGTFICIDNLPTGEKVQRQPITPEANPTLPTPIIMPA